MMNELSLYATHPTLSPVKFLLFAVELPAKPELLIAAVTKQSGRHLSQHLNLEFSVARTVELLMEFPKCFNYCILVCFYNLTHKCLDQEPRVDGERDNPSLTTY